MYRLLIVDDEKIIVDGLLEIFQSSRFPELDIYKANSVPEALRVMNRVKIDVVITDITMPGMSGLEFHGEIRRYWPFCRVIYLTGYNQFEYAQSAIRNEATEFILKTEGEERIIEAYTKAITSIEKELKDQIYLDKARNQMKLALPLLQRSFLLELANGVECSSEDRKRQFVELDIPLDYNMGIFLLLMRVDYWSQGINFTGKTKALYMMQNIVGLHFANLVVFMPVILEDVGILWIIQPEGMKSVSEKSHGETEDWQRTVSIVHGYVDALQRTIKEAVKIPVSFIVSHDVSNWEGMNDTFERMKARLNKAAGVCDEVLLVDGEEISAVSGEGNLKTDSAIRLQLRDVERLVKHLDGGQKAEFTAVFRKMVLNIKGVIQLEDPLAAEFYYSIAAVFMTHLCKNRLINQLTANMDIHIENVVKMEVHPSWDEIYEYFIKLADFIFDQKTNEYMMSTRKIVDKVYMYIEQNPDKDLSLNKLAELARFSPFYLSRLYKQTTGKSISEHISEVKLQKAKELLRKSNMKINDIALALGFNTPSYFTCFFKRNVVVSPLEYRNSSIEYSNIQTKDGR